MHVLHLIERLTFGGAARSLIAASAELQRTSGISHSVHCLRPSAPAAERLARDGGLGISTAADPATAIAAADIVHIHYWNGPDLNEAIRRPLSACRTILTAHIVGSTPPHIVTDELVEFADILIATTPDTADVVGNAHAGSVRIIPEAADFTRLRGFEPVAHETFTIGYVGTVDFAKMHPDYVAMHAKLGLAHARVLVCGAGGAFPILKRQAQALGIAEMFDFAGYVSEIGSALARMDVFGYPLCEQNYATTELVLHEAMYAGLPCVVLTTGGARHTIVDGETGFVVSNQDEYVEAIRLLHADKGLRRRIGANAAEHARREFGAERVAPQLESAYSQLLGFPKRPRELRRPRTGSEAFLLSLGWAAAVFERSRSGDDDADDEILHCSPALASADGGGVLHYRRAYPDDPQLRYWAGLVLLGQGRPALAAAEFKAAARSFDRERSLRRLAQAIAEGIRPLKDREEPLEASIVSP